MTPSTLVTFQAFWKGDYSRSDGWQVSKVILKGDDKVERASSALNLQFDEEQEQLLTFKWKEQGQTLRENKWKCTAAEAKTLRLYAHLFLIQRLDQSNEKTECELPFILEKKPKFAAGKTYTIHCEQTCDRLTASIQLVEMPLEEIEDEDKCLIM
jgi:hypothetical protein